MHAKISILCKIGYSWGPNGYPGLGPGLGWALEVGPKTQLGLCQKPIDDSQLAKELNFEENISLFEELEL